MSYEAAAILGFMHTLEDIALALRHRKQWEAARQVDLAVELLRKEIDVQITQYENHRR